VNSIQITTQGMTGGTDNAIDSKSTDGDDFNATINGKTITFTAKDGKALKNNQYIWMRIPEGPQPGTEGSKIYKGKVTTAALTPPPSPEVQMARVPEAGNTAGAVVAYQSTTQTLSFSAGNVSFTTYFDDTTVMTNGPGETVIGAEIQVGDMHILGPSSSVPGAFALSDSGVALVVNGETVLQGEVVNSLLIPDLKRPVFAEIQGSLLSFFTEGVMHGSQYISEFFSNSTASDLFVETDLLAATDNLAMDGAGHGGAVIASVSVPEPSTWAMLLLGLAGLSFAGYRKAKGERTAFPPPDLRNRGKWKIAQAAVFRLR
jgi:PEP-CTERM motif-containing protein